MITFRAKVFHTQGTNLAIAALSLITGVVLARFLGVEARGELAIIMIWPPILSLVGLMGLHEAAAYFVARSDEKVARRHISAAFMMATFFLALVTLAYSYYLPTIFPNLSGEKIMWARWYAPMVILNAYVTFFGVLDLSLNFIKRANYQRLVLMLIYALSLLILVSLKWLSVPTALASHLISLIVVVVAWLYYYRHHFTLRWTLAPALRLLKNGLSFQVGLLCAALLVMADKLLVTHLFSADQVGLYVVAHTIVFSYFTLLLSAQQSLVFPLLSGMAEEEKREFFEKNFNFNFYLSLLAVFPLITAAPWAIKILFGSAFQEAVAFVPLLTVAYALIFFKIFGSRALRGFGYALIGNSSDLILLGSFLAGALVAKLTVGLSLAMLLSLLVISGIVGNLWFVFLAVLKLDLSFRTLFSPTLFMKSLAALIKR